MIYGGKADAETDCWQDQQQAMTTRLVQCSEYPYPNIVSATSFE